MDYRKSRIMDDAFERRVKSDKNPALWVAILAFALVGTVISAFVIQQYWAWFIVPLGVPVITPGHALGISFFVDYFKTTSSEKRDPSEWVAKIVTAILMNGVYLALGYIAFQLI